MADIKHDLNVLAAIAKMDRVLIDRQAELDHIPQKITVIDKKLAVIEKTRKEAYDRFEAMQKERKDLDRKLQDNEELITKYKNQLFDIKKNKEYQAMLKEIETLESDIDTKEERLLELMDELDSRGEEHEAEIKRISQEESQYLEEKEAHESRERSLQEEISKIETQKPGLLKDVAPSLQNKYKRLQDNLGFLPAARIEAENCGGCRRKLPPQLAHEVARNDQLITCEGCGRILIHYTD